MGEIPYSSHQNIDISDMILGIRRLLYVKYDVLVHTYLTLETRNTIYTRQLTHLKLQPPES